MPEIPYVKGDAPKCPERAIARECRPDMRLARALNGCTPERVSRVIFPWRVRVTSVRIADGAADARILYLCCVHACRAPCLTHGPQGGSQAAASSRACVRPHQGGGPGPPLRGRHAPHRRRSGRGGRRVPDPGAGSTAPPRGRRADQALPEEGRAGARGLRAGDLRRRGDPAARRGVRRTQGRARVGAADRPARTAPGGAAGARRGGRPGRGVRQGPLLPRRDREERGQRDPVAPLRPAPRPASCGWVSR